MDERRALLADWLEKKTSFRGGVLSIASADASFRRYFRLLQGGKSYIVMDAPPDLEPSLAFVEIGTWMKFQSTYLHFVYKPIQNRNKI